MRDSGRLYRLPNIGEIANNVQTGYVAPLHFHETYSIGIFRGPAQIWCRDRIWHIDAGSVVILEPHEPHGGTATSRTCSQDMILLEKSLMIRMFGSAYPLRFPNHIIRDSVLAQEFSEAVDSGEVLLITEAIRKLGSIYGVRRSGEELSSVQVQSTVDLAHQSVSEASRASRTSRSHFSRLMRRRTGLPPRDLRRQIRVERARALIENGETLASAAAGAGFADQAHMTRQLRSLLGVTPSALRRNAAKA